MTITFARTFLLAGLGTLALGGCSSNSTSASSDGGSGDAASNDGSSSGADTGTDGGSGTDATAGAVGIIATVNGTVVDFSVAAVVTPSNGGNYTNFVGRGADGSMLSVTATGGAVGTYKCNVDARTAMGYTAPGAITVNSLYQANTDTTGNCTVVFTQFGPTGGQLKGTFAGHLTNRAAAATELTNGTFTLDSP